MIEFNNRNFRSWSIMGINPCIWSVAFADILERRDDVVALTADLARYSGMVRTQKKYPEAFYNVGIAEQNMVGIGAGLALSGYDVYMTTYAPFMSYRCADQIRHLAGNLNLKLKAIGSAAGLSAGLSGNSLLAISDIAFMRSIPNMVVLSPADCTEAVKMILAIAEHNGPVYMRFCGTVALPQVYEEDYEFKLGKAVELSKGDKIALLATGTDLVVEAKKTAEILKKRLGIEVTVANIHTIKPLDGDYLEGLVAAHELLVTIEEHNVIGGLGSAVAEFGATLKSFPQQLFIGINDCNYVLGSRKFMLEQCGLTADKMAEKICKAYNGDTNND